MKKLAAVSICGMLLLSCALPISWAVEDEATGTGMSGTSQEFSDLQKTLKSERMDNLEQSVSELKQTISSLTDRVQDLERTVDDFNGRQ
ncbi:MAG: hypothetical protein WCJ71_10630 [Candidatus Omnitrophota bacterium]